MREGVRGEGRRRTEKQINTQRESDVKKLFKLTVETRVPMDAVPE